MSAQGLPTNLLALFAPRPPQELSKPIQPHLHPRMDLMSSMVENFEDELPPERLPYETPLERKTRLAQARDAEHSAWLESERVKFKPGDDQGLTIEPFRTLFVGRLAYETTERTLRQVFEEWGVLKHLRTVTDKEGKSRGYAFVEYETERHMRDAYKASDGIRIDGRSILVDVERARTVPGWTPRRLGGGKGPGRVGFDPKQKQQHLPPTRPVYRDDHRRNRSRSRDRYDSRRYDSRYSNRR